jgi:hypothetical protein
MHTRLFTFAPAKRKIVLSEASKYMAIRKLKSDGQIARAAVNLGISVAGLVIIRLIVQNLPMFQDVGWIVKDKLSVAAAAVIAVDAMLLSVLVGFAAQIRAYLFARFREVPALGSMAVSFVLLICAGPGVQGFQAADARVARHQRPLRLGILHNRCGLACLSNGPAVPEQGPYGGAGAGSAHARRSVV